MVMAYVWVGMLVLSVFSSLLKGSFGTLSPALMEGASAAITLSLSLAGALCLWSGVARVMERAGLSKKLAHLMRPVFRRLFPNASRDEAAMGYLSANVSANLMGLGNAATPMGINAVKRMKVLSGSETATDEMCLLIVMNTASIQLLPTTVATVRAAAGASAPFDILPAVWITSLCSVTAGILAAKLLRGRRKHA
ncbi:MAG: spore maturation protein A [Oscillospiraceae bacterium]|nr:spore maturation protein A [Oscillospiraceae bacterium]